MMMIMMLKRNNKIANGGGADGVATSEPPREAGDPCRRTRRCLCDTERPMLTPCFPRPIQDLATSSPRLLLVAATTSEGSRRDDAVAEPCG